MSYQVEDVTLIRMTIIVMMSIVVIPKKQCRVKFPFTPATATLPSVSAAITQLGREGDTLLNIQLLNFLMLNFQLLIIQVLNILMLNFQLLNIQVLNILMLNFQLLIIQLLNFQLSTFQLLNCVNSKS